MNLALGSKTHHCIYFQKNLPARWWCLDSLHWITALNHSHPLMLWCVMFSLSSFSIWSSHFPLFPSFLFSNQKLFLSFIFIIFFPWFYFLFSILKKEKKNENRNKKRRKDSLYSLTLTCSFPNSSSHPQLSWFIHWNPHPSIHIHKHMNFLHFFFFLFSLECLLISKFSFYLLFFLK